ncbi:c-type cytochrome [Methylobacillus flagellatus]|uniref:c-type cytochrome n=1 Tax=Methylobacillus flagellatus TaxID=405 RepID=UPI0010F59FE2|nr:c-type cytochrome [Methylobacillus flagellatus]
MSAHDHDFPKTTPAQVILAVLGAIIAPALIIFLIVKMVLGVQNNYLPDADPAVLSSAAEERIKPVAAVDVADPSAEVTLKTGEEVVQGICAGCHGAGAFGAPKLGDEGAWAPRIAQGYETLVKHAIEGIRQMPARGGSPDLSDIEVARAVAYMGNQAGASFTEPEAPAAEE